MEKEENDENDDPSCMPDPCKEDYEMTDGIIGPSPAGTGNTKDVQEAGSDPTTVDFDESQDAKATDSVPSTTSDYCHNGGGDNDDYTAADTMCKVVKDVQAEAGTTSTVDVENQETSDDCANGTCTVLLDKQDMEETPTHVLDLQDKDTKETGKGNDGDDLVGPAIVGAIHPDHSMESSVTAATTASLKEFSSTEGDDEKNLENAADGASSHMSSDDMDGGSESTQKEEEERRHRMLVVFKKSNDAGTQCCGKNRLMMVTVLVVVVVLLSAVIGLGVSNQNLKQEVMLLGISNQNLKQEVMLLGITSSPSLSPTSQPTTAAPTVAPTVSPTTARPTGNPTSGPTGNPTPAPTDNPTGGPTDKPTPRPTDSPTLGPTNKPTPTPTEKPTPRPTEKPTPRPTNPITPQPTQPPDPFLVGAYYYPWHGDGNFHNGQGYLRRELKPRHGPILGEYNDRNGTVIQQHLEWSRRANLGLWVTSWWGPDTMEDITTRTAILPQISSQSNENNLKIALHYETMGRLQSQSTNQNDLLLRAKQDMEHICQHYFQGQYADAYFHIDGRPVLYVYVSRWLERENHLEDVILILRSTAIKCGTELFLVGDHVFSDAPPADEESVVTPLWYFDAVTNYDAYGAMGRPSPFATRKVVDRYYQEQAEWKVSALDNDCRFIPVVSPGYNDRGVRLEIDHPPLSRRLEDSEEEDGSLFWYQLTQAKPLADEALQNLIMINSFNEWHEDTQIEPAYGEVTSDPFDITQGIVYKGYGTLYLDLLQRATARATMAETNFPTDITSSTSENP